MKVLINIAGVIANIATSKVTSDVIKNVLPPAASKIGKVLNVIGVACISGLVADAAQNYAEEELNKGVKLIAQLAPKKSEEEDEDGGED